MIAGETCAGSLRLHGDFALCQEMPVCCRSSHFSNFSRATNSIIGIRQIPPSYGFFIRPAPVWRAEPLCNPNGVLLLHPSSLHCQPVTQNEVTPTTRFGTHSNESRSMLRYRGSTAPPGSARRQEVRSVRQLDNRNRGIYDC